MNTPPSLITSVAILCATAVFVFAEAVVAPPDPAAAAAAPSPPVTPVSALPADPNSAASDPYSDKPPEYNSSPMVRVDVLMVSLSEERALPLFPKLRDPEQIQAAQEK